ncbi:CoA-binding protein [bacterium]|nr:CoA-binding protein [bacterium]
MLTVEQALKIIKTNRKVAIVGLSPKEDRPSFRVAKFLLDKGFHIIPINPTYEKILGIPCKKSLSDLSAGEIDWIDFFVNPSRLMDFSATVLKLSPKLVWCQIGVVSEPFNQELDKAGIPFIANVCPKIELEKVG